MKRPDTSFAFVVEWFEKAVKAAESQGKKDSALLWKDGLQHLKYLGDENRKLRELLKMEQDGSSEE